MLQVQNSKLHLNAYFGSPAVVAFGNALDTHQQFQYLSSTMQIYNPALNLCLDDQGFETLGTSSYSAYLSFLHCDSTSINQQFIITTNNQIYNPNWPNNQVCINGNGYSFDFALLTSTGQSYVGFNEAIYWGCSTSDSNEMFNVILVCPPGARHP